MEYNIWNNLIFEYFFNSSKKDQEVLFCVDESVLINIARRENIELSSLSDADIIKDFCSAVVPRIVKQAENGKYNINLKDVSSGIRDRIPVQTAVLAFFILCASKMGIDTEDNDNKQQVAKTNTRAYYRYAAEYFTLVGYENDKKEVSLNNSASKFSNLFEAFEDYLLNKLNKTLGYIKIIRYYEEQNKERKLKDHVGICVYQSMISELDRCLLTQFFDDMKSKYNSLNLNLLPVQKYTKRFNYSWNDKQYNEKLKAAVQRLYDNWDGLVYVFNEKTKKTEVKLNRKLFYIKNSDDEIVFYEYIKTPKRMDRPELLHYTFEENWNGYIKQVDANAVLERLDSDKFVLFMEPENECDLMEEVSSVKIGEKFAICMEKEFFADLKNKKEIYKRVKAGNGNPPNTTRDFVLWENVMAVYSDGADDRFGIVPESEGEDDIIADVCFVKGLKIKYKTLSAYFKGAEPLIYISPIAGHGSIRYRINKEQTESFTFPAENEKQEYIDPRKYNLDVQNRISIVDFRSKSKEFIIIKPLKDRQSCDFNKLYIKQNADDEHNWVNGCYIENYFYEEESKAVSRRVFRITSILNALSKKDSESRNCAQNFKITPKSNLPKFCFAQLAGYLKNNKKITFPEWKYLQELRKEGIIE